MPTPAEFFEFTKLMGIATLVMAGFTLLTFAFGWGFRFRLVGVTGFMGVLTVGFFGLSFQPLTRTSIPGAIPFQTVYDSGSAQVVIKVPDTVTESQLDATLRQAASNLFNPSRLGPENQRATIRARAILHESGGRSHLLYLGQVQAIPNPATGEAVTVTLNPEAVAQLPAQG
ncbi:MAG: Ycf51 family protein [Cyanobacteria bacterium]|nr:Ycf51 family protein [Cyanobacteriota bacterium]